ncbi:hypothetical protein BU15DRAFT_85872 [Melanogaster broomeanus]|nr:hypothetical protein BU15DRAFT_85872 [Melanogaster broomeanus]
MDFLDKVLDYAERLPEGIERTRDQIIGRHDTVEEKLNDQIRAQINAGHRFESFANQRGENAVKWHIDGHDYMWALSEMLESAKDVIFILDWWLTPELYLRWRLDRVLQRKAQEGVRIYVVVYKEVTATMSMNSKHTKESIAALEALHPNIACMRHPDHIGSKGRCPSDQLRSHTLPGQDYNNARFLDFQEVDNYISNAVSVLETPRMPWHDVHMTICGSVVLDICQHFVERWNEIKRRKVWTGNNHVTNVYLLILPASTFMTSTCDKSYPTFPPDPNLSRFDWLALPHNTEVAPNEAVVRHPHREQWHQMGRRFRQRFHLHYGDEVEPPYAPPPHGTCRVQAVRSVSDWSHGVLTEHSIQNAYIQLIREANHFIYIGSISNTQDDGPVKNKIAKALVERISRCRQSRTKGSRSWSFIPELPGFAGDTIMAAQYRTINRGGHSIYEEIRKAGYEPTDYIRFFHLRSYDRINAPLKTLIAQMEANSGVTFHEAQIALARQWVGRNHLGKDAPREVLVKVPQESKEGIVVSEQTPAKNEKVPLPDSYEAARDVVAQFESGSESIRGDEMVADSVSQHALQDKTDLRDELWMGSEDEELNSLAITLVIGTNPTRTQMGSANLNDRSQRGDGDSEIALVVEDNDMIKTTMDGRPYMAARFAASLRRKLFRGKQDPILLAPRPPDLRCGISEHLGLIPPQNVPNDVTWFMKPAPEPNDDETDLPEDAAVADPLADETLDLLYGTARKNREIFTEIFRPVPTNLVRSWSAYENYVPKVKCGHVAPDVPLSRVKDRLSQVKGSLVECPLDFVEGIDWLGLNPTLPVYL